MFCPLCRSEYREGFTECSDCGVPLVPELPDDRVEYLDFVPVMTVTNESDLCVIKSVFDGNGIRYYLKGEFSHFDSFISTELMVSEEDVSDARNILRELNLL
jgi:hypothetical protein